MRFCEFSKAEIFPMIRAIRLRFRRFPVLAGVMLVVLISPANAQSASAQSASAQSTNAQSVRTEEPLTWEDAVKQLLARNPDAALAEVAVAAARADLQRASVRPNSQLTLGDSGWRRAGPASSDASLSAQIDQAFERGNKRGLRIDAARAQIDAVGDESNDIRRLLLQSLAETFADVAAAGSKVELSRAIAETFERVATLAQKRVDAGDLSPTDAVRARADAQRALNDVTAAAQELSLARVRLAFLLGQPAQNATLMVKTDGLPSRIPQDLAALAEKRADVRAARARLRASESAAELALAQRTRDVSIGFQLAHSSGDAGPKLGLSVSIPLFTGNYFEGDIQRSITDRDAAQLLLQKTLQNARAEVARLESTLSSVAERERRIRESVVPLARRAADAVQYAFGRGAGTVLDVLDARRQLRAAELEAIAALAELQKARAALALFDVEQSAPASTLLQSKWDTP